MSKNLGGWARFGGAVPPWPQRRTATGYFIIVNPNSLRPYHTTLGPGAGPTCSKILAPPLFGLLTGSGRVTGSKALSRFHLCVNGCWLCWLTDWLIGNALVSSNEVTQSRARLILGQVTVGGQANTSVCNQPPRSTQPCNLCGTVK